MTLEKVGQHNSNFTSDADVIEVTIMKILQRILILLSLPFVSGSIAAERKAALLHRMATVHAQVFPQGNLFNQRIGNINLWNNLLGRLQNYIDENSGGNRKLLAIVSRCKQVSQELIKTIRWTHLWVFSPSIDSGVVYKNYLSVKNNNIKTLKMRKTELKKDANMLKNTGYYRNGKKKNNATQVLLQFVLLLERTINRTIGDFKAAGDKLRPDYLFFSG